jgi:hypothetical protein
MARKHGVPDDGTRSVWGSAPAGRGGHGSILGRAPAFGTWRGAAMTVPTGAVFAVDLGAVVVVDPATAVSVADRAWLPHAAPHTHASTAAAGDERRNMCAKRPTDTPLVGSDA